VNDVSSVDPLWTIDEAALYLRVPVKMLYQWNGEAKVHRSVKSAGICGMTRSVVEGSCGPDDQETNPGQGSATWDGAALPGVLSRSRRP